MATDLENNHRVVERINKFDGICYVPILSDDQKICYSVDYDSLIYQLKECISELSKKQVEKLCYGFTCGREVEKNLEKLDGHLSILKKEIDIFSFGGKPFLSPINLQKLKEKITKLCPNCNKYNQYLIPNEDLQIQISDVVDNPRCIPYQKWEKYAVAFCDNLKIELKTIEQKCNIAFDIISKKICPELLVQLNVFKQACDLGFNIARKEICGVGENKYKLNFAAKKLDYCESNLSLVIDEKTCGLAFNLLKKEFNCNLDYKIYKKLIDCGLTPDLIFKVYEQECSLDLKVNNNLLSLQNVDVISESGNKYNIQDLFFSQSTLENIKEKWQEI